MHIATTHLLTAYYRLYFYSILLRETLYLYYCLLTLLLKTSASFVCLVSWREKPTTILTSYLQPTYSQTPSAWSALADPLCQTPTLHYNLPIETLQSQPPDQLRPDSSL